MRKKQMFENKNKVGDYRHDEAKRRNNPPAGIAPTYEVQERKTKGYSYDPHLDPQLIWAGKTEHTSFEVDIVSLHIHERISTRAILEAVKKPEPQLSLFGETQLPADQQIEFYQHEVGWVNRLILGDSLLVMNSLLIKEGMAGKVQLIYMDPPYGIKYSSNFQPRVDRRDVKDKDEDLTHEPEQIKAYRDTWKLGIHSYITYLRDRLLLARELLTESGSIFLQINDENLHLTRILMDEVFGRENFVSVISFRKTTGFPSKLLGSVYDYLLWFAKNKELVKYRQLYRMRTEEMTSGAYQWIELESGKSRRLISKDFDNGHLGTNGKRFSTASIMSSGATEEGSKPYELNGIEYRPAAGTHWKTTTEGLNRLAEAGRLVGVGKTLTYKRYEDDFPIVAYHSVWDDTLQSTFAIEKLYAVQTATEVIERCILMTTDPGDLVLDPTCGSGTTAFCAEKRGRRWITCDTSRVALAISRQRLMTARYDYYELKEPERGPAGGFNYEEVPHMTLESIAKNPEIGAIAEKYQDQIDKALFALNRALGKKLKEWEVPGQAEMGWGKEAKTAHESFLSLKRRKRHEIDASIDRYAPREMLYDRPHIKSGVVRVSGPFTVEAIPAPSIEDPSQAPIPTFEAEEAQVRISDRGGDYLSTIINLLQQQGGVLFPGGQKMELSNLRSLNVGLLHAEAETKKNERTVRVALSLGPQHGPITAFQVQEAIPVAKMNGYQVLIFAGFSFDPEAQAIIQKAPVPAIQVHFANIAPDVLVGDLLKTTRASQIFTVFGQPDVRVEKLKDGTYVAELLGVDIYDPLRGETNHVPGDDVAAWFLDSDYDGKAFHICQAFFPGDAGAWDKIQRALKAQIDPDAFERMRGTRSFPFKPGDCKRIAVKVIDFRGNEVMKLTALEEKDERKTKYKSRR